MVRNENIEESIANKKVCTQLGHLVKQNFTELGEVYGSDKVPQDWHRVHQR